MPYVVLENLKLKRSSHINTQKKTSLLNSAYISNLTWCFNCKNCYILNNLQAIKVEQNFTLH